MYKLQIWQADLLMRDEPSQNFWKAVPEMSCSELLAKISMATGIPVERLEAVFEKVLSDDDNTEGTTPEISLEHAEAIIMKRVFENLNCPEEMLTTDDLEFD